jgi:peroxiredoxin
MQLLRDRSQELEQAGVRPFGISRDSPYTHISWMQALDLTVPLLSDWNAEAVRGFGLARSWRGMTDVPVRSAFLVDQGGTVRRSWRYDDSEVPDLDPIVAAAQAL